MKIQKKRRANYSQDDICYGIGLFILALICIFGPLYYFQVFTLSDISPACFFHTATGLSCPGCGCTRAVHALFDGKILESLKFNPIIIYFFLLYIPFMITNTVAKVRNRIYIKKQKKTGESIDSPVSVTDLPYHGMHAKDIYFYIAIAILLSFWLVRLCFEILHIVS